MKKLFGIQESVPPIEQNNVQVPLNIQIVSPPVAAPAPVVTGVVPGGARNVVVHQPVLVQAAQPVAHAPLLQQRVYASPAPAYNLGQPVNLAPFDGRPVVRRYIF